MRGQEGEGLLSHKTHEVEVHLTKNDFRQFNRYFFFQKGLRKRLLIILFAALMLPLLLNGLEDFSIGSYLINAVLAGVVFTIIYIGGMLLLLRMANLPSEKDGVLGRKKFLITEDGLGEESASGRSLTPWDSMESVEHNRDFIFIFIDKMTAYVIPKRSFENKDHEQEFYNLLMERI